jgi:hypothetical protein
MRLSVPRKECRINIYYIKDKKLLYPSRCKFEPGKEDHQKPGLAVESVLAILLDELEKNPREGQSSFSTQLSHAGFRAWQTRRP